MNLLKNSFTIYYFIFISNKLYHILIYNMSHLQRLKFIYLLIFKSFIFTYEDNVYLELQNKAFLLSKTNYKIVINFSSI